MNFADKKGLILGLGESGLSAAHWLMRRGAVLRVADTRDSPERLPQLITLIPHCEFIGGPFTSSLLDGIDFIVVSPGLSELNELRDIAHQAKERGIIKRHGRRWVVRSNLPRQMLIYSNGEANVVILGTFRNASKVGRHMTAVKRFLRSNDPAHLKPFIGKSVTDIRGDTHIFETNPNTIYRLSAVGAESFEQVYRIII